MFCIRVSVLTNKIPVDLRQLSSTAFELPDSQPVHRLAEHGLDEVPHEHRQKHQEANR